MGGVGDVGMGCGAVISRPKGNPTHLISNAYKAYTHPQISHIMGLGWVTRKADRYACETRLSVLAHVLNLTFHSVWLIVILYHLFFTYRQSNSLKCENGKVCCQPSWSSSVSVLSTLSSVSSSVSLPQVYCTVRISTANIASVAHLTDELSIGPLLRRLVLLGLVRVRVRVGVEFRVRVRVRLGKVRLG